MDEKSNRASRNRSDTAADIRAEETVGWMNTLKFFCPGRPIPTARPRVTRYRTYLPKSSVQAQKRVSEAAVEAVESAGGSDGPLWATEALYLQIDAVFPYAKGTPKKKMKPGWTPRVGRPDLDNLAKTVLDGMDKIIYADDAQIVELNVSKHMTADANLAGWYVKAEVIGD